MVGRKVYDDFDPVLMGRRDQIIEIGPAVARVTEVFFDALAQPVTSTRRRLAKKLCYRQVKLHGKNSILITG
jgi:hypothetical protein